SVEEAFQAVPANRRDSWRIHRVDVSDTFATLAKKYSTTALLISSTNHDEMPEPGSLAAIPVSYPGDPVPVQRRGQSHAVARKTPAKSTAAAPARKLPTPTRTAAPSAKKPVATGKTAPKTASRITKPAPLKRSRA